MIDYPEQSELLYARVEVTFGDGVAGGKGTTASGYVVRHDAAGFAHTIIALDDGRFVTGGEVDWKQVDPEEEGDWIQPGEAAELLSVMLNKPIRRQTVQRLSVNGDILWRARIRFERLLSKASVIELGQRGLPRKKAGRPRKQEDIDAER